MNNLSLDGFDPLSERFGDIPGERTIFEQATKRVVQNILKSYTGYFDVFSEIIQNSLDAIDARVKLGDDRIGKIVVRIDIGNGVIRITDNGIGMSSDELRYCFRPSVSFKNRKESRGNKGVGATFLAYGFSSIVVITRRNSSEIAVQLDGGKAWADDFGDTHLRPKLAMIETDYSDFIDNGSGTSTTIRIGRGNRPDLTWWGATSAQQWLEMLKSRTPLGGVYIYGKSRPNVGVSVEVIDGNGNSTYAHSDSVEYIWPHELPVLSKVQDIDEISKQLAKIDADLSRLPAGFKNLSAVYKVWTMDEILKNEGNFWGSIFDEQDTQLIRLHQMSIYGCFLSSAKSWTEYQENILKIRKNPLILKGGMQIASDNMIQGDLMVIPLTSTIGYQANTHVVIHLKDGNPDMGRKVFQPEIKALAEKTSRQVVNIFKRFLHLMREDTGGPSITDSTDMFEWQIEKKQYLVTNPLSFSIGGFRIPYIALPRSEQDVISIFHELIGANILKGIQFIGTSSTDRYDCCFVNFYNDDAEIINFQKVKTPLGISQKISTTKMSAPRVLEFKYNLDGLIADFETENKFLKDINLLVCWSIGERYKERYRLSSFMIGDEGANREIFGSTHALWLERTKQFEIICISDLLSFISNQDQLVALHEAKFSD